MFFKKKTLTGLSSTCGWAAKLGPTVLSDALGSLNIKTDPNLLVGIESSDDAAVYRIDPERALVNTTDFITPPVDDPIWFGRIAAANSLSDVYAMGGKPLYALNIIMFPIKELGPEILQQILKGGLEKIEEAGALMVGGHSIQDSEPKYGLAVTGIVHPDRILRNNGARPGDAIVLTKPLGTGVLFNAVTSGKLSLSDLAPMLPLVASLNRTAMETALEFKINACTDVTGFGISGHLVEMARGSSVGISITYNTLPLYANALEMYRLGETTGSNRLNREFASPYLEIKASLTKHEEGILFDPQTSGGLLLSLPSAEAEALVLSLKNAGIADAAIIGQVSDKKAGFIEIV